MDKYMQLTIMILMLSLSTSLVLTYFFGLLGIIPAIALMLVVTFVIRRKQMKAMGYSGTGYGTNEGVSYYCIACGAKHKSAQCPKCGSRMKKAGW